MKETEKQELVSSALDGLTLAIDSLKELNSIRPEMISIIQRVENVFSSLLAEYEKN